MLWKVYPGVIQMLISLTSYLVSIQTGHCNAYTKNLLHQDHVNSSNHLLSALAINTDHTLWNECCILVRFTYHMSLRPDTTTQ